MNTMNTMNINNKYIEVSDINEQIRIGNFLKYQSMSF